MPATTTATAPDPTAAELPGAVRVNTALELLDIGRSTLYRWEEAGLIRLVRVGASVRVPVSEIRRIIDGAAA